MKKIAIATLLVASTMVATAQVRLTGKVSEFVDNTKTGAVSKTSLVADPTSNITFSATEKIIGTLTANVVLDKVCQLMILSVVQTLNWAIVNQQLACLVKLVALT